MNAIPAPTLPRNRAAGELRARFDANPRGLSHVAQTFEGGGLRLRFPKVAPGAMPNVEAVCINTAGGMVGGDSARLAFDFGPGAGATITTQSAEKIYRAEDATTRIETRLILAERARAEWLPQETILFDRVNLRRRLDVDMAGDADLLIVEAFVFGRLAMGESVRTGTLRDDWRVRRDGRLVFAEALALEGDIARHLDRTVLGAGARAVATLLLVSPEAERQLEAVRAALETVDCPAGASTWNGLLTVRLMSPSPERVRAAIVTLLQALRGRAAPRVWQ